MAASWKSTRDGRHSYLLPFLQALRLRFLRPVPRRRLLLRHTLQLEGLTGRTLPAIYSTDSRPASKSDRRSRKLEQAADAWRGVRPDAGAISSLAVDDAEAEIPELDFAPGLALVADGWEGCAGPGLPLAVPARDAAHLGGTCLLELGRSGRLLGRAKEGPVNPFTKPSMIMVELTNLCNLRCKMCGIWEEKPKRTLDVQTLDTVLSQKAASGLKVIALTGGEPFLVHNFFDYYAVSRARRPRAHVNISSNGYYTDKTLDFLGRAQDKNLSITISYDGVRSHDTIRGVAGSADKLLRTAARIREEFPKVKVSLKLTAMAENHSEIADTAEQCQAMGIPFRFKTLEKLNCHQSRFPSEIQGPNYNPAIVTSIATQAKQVLDMPGDTNRIYLRQLLQLYEGNEVGCACSVRTLFLGFDGKVFICRKKDSIGNVLEHSLDHLWEADQKHKIVHQMKHCDAANDTLGFGHH